MREETPEQRRRRIFFHWQECGRHDKAIEAGHEVLAFAPEDAAIHSAIGVSYMALGEDARAREHYTTALSIDPEDSRTRALLSFAEMKRFFPRYGRAEKEAINSLAQDPDSYAAWYSLGWATRMYEEEFAMECNDRLLALQPDNESGYLQRAHFLASFEGKRVDEGEAMIHKALGLAPNESETHQDAAEFFLNFRKDRTRAEHHIDIALKIDPNDDWSRAFKHKLRLHRNWVARVLRAPWSVATSIFAMIGRWSNLKIWWFTWPLALWIGIVALWLTALWLLTLFPILKYYEWLLLRAVDLRWKMKRFSRVFGAPEPVRWILFFSGAVLYLGGIWALFFYDGGNTILDIAGVIVSTIFFGGLALAIVLGLWGKWRKKSLHRRIGPLNSMPSAEHAPRQATMHIDDPK